MNKRDFKFGESRNASVKHNLETNKFLFKRFQNDRKYNNQYRNIIEYSIIFLIIILLNKEQVLLIYFFP